MQWRHLKMASQRLRRSISDEMDDDVSLKKVFKRLAKRFKVASKCKSIGDDAVAGFVRHKGKLYHIVISTVDENNFCVQVPKEEGDSP